MAVKVLGVMGAGAVVVVGGVVAPGSRETLPADGVVKLLGEIPVGLVVPLKEMPMTPVEDGVTGLGAGATALGPGLRSTAPEVGSGFGVAPEAPLWQRVSISIICWKKRGLSR